jgi:hypothetical protein
MITFMIHNLNNIDKEIKIQHLMIKIINLLKIMFLEKVAMLVIAMRFLI